MDIIIDQFTKNIRHKLQKRLKKIILFGSRARGDADEWSDYDFVIIIDKRDKEIENQIYQISGDLFYEYSKLIGSVIWDETEWNDRKKYPIGLNIIREGKEF